MSDDNATQSALQQLIADDAIGQLRRRTGRMATLGSEEGALKLDWVEGVARLLEDPTRLEQIEAEAREIGQHGIRHIIWAGMGGQFSPYRSFTATYTRRTLVNWIDFLQQVEAWIPPEVERVDAVLDNLTMHRAMDVLLFNLAYPRWEFVFQPTYAAYLHLIEPWWKTLKSLALKGRRFETWHKIEEAVRKATSYWNAHKHPYVWGRRRRHRPHRTLGIARLPNVA